MDAERLGEILVKLGFVAESKVVENDPEEDPNLPLNNGPARVNERDKVPGSVYAGPM